MIRKHFLSNLISIAREMQAGVVSSCLVTDDMETIQ
jgi:hypothetical protein